jgi:hypothetical protein
MCQAFGAEGAPGRSYFRRARSFTGAAWPVHDTGGSGFEIPISSSCEAGFRAATLVLHGANHCNDGMDRVRGAVLLSRNWGPVPLDLATSRPR